VDRGYATLAIPFTPLDAPDFEMRVDWNAHQLLAYLSSWSAAQRYRSATGSDAIRTISTDLVSAWGAPGRTRPVRWTLALRAGRID
jgi:hypothetical protein